MKNDNEKYIQLFKKTYTEHYYKVKYFAGQYLNDEIDAESVAQDVFVSFWENIERIDFSANVLSYLFTSARNKALNMISKESYRLKYSKDAKSALLNDIGARLLSDEATEKIIKCETEEILVKAMKKMKTEVRDTFILCKIKGYKLKETAEIQNISEKTVELRIKKAMLVLRKMFSEYLYFLFLFFLK